MSTICKIVLKGVHEQAVISSIKAFDSDIEWDTVPSQWPKASAAESFRNSHAFPTILSIKAVTREYLEVHFNSFANLKALIEHLTRELGTTGVINLYQSVSTSSHWMYCDRGLCLREIEAGDGEVMKDLGEPFEFEGAYTGHDIGEEGELCVVFDDEDQDCYNAEVGFMHPVYFPYENDWVNLMRAGPTPLESDSMPDLQTKSPSKPWWKFW